MTLHYTSTAVAAALSGGINNVATAITVTTVTGYPTVPYEAIIGRGTISEEAVLVTAVSGLNLTVTRGYAGTSAVTHSSGETFEHGVTSVPLNDLQTHIAATSAHGVSGAVVGTTDPQTLTSKTLTTPTLTAPVIADFSSAQHDHGDADDGGLITLGNAWTAFSPALGNTVGSPVANFTLGNGTLTGKKLVYGKRADVFIKLASGSTTNPTTGQLFFDAPETPATTRVCLDVIFIRASDGALFRGTAQYWNGANGLKFYVSVQLSSGAENETGSFYSNGDVLVIKGSYEVA